MLVKMLYNFDVSSIHISRRNIVFPPIASLQVWDFARPRRSADSAADTEGLEHQAVCTPSSMIPFRICLTLITGLKADMGVGEPKLSLPSQWLLSWSPSGCVGCQVCLDEASCGYRRAPTVNLWMWHPFQLHVAWSTTCAHVGHFVNECIG